MNIRELADNLTALADKMDAEGSSEDYYAFVATRDAEETATANVEFYRVDDLEIDEEGDVWLHTTHLDGVLPSSKYIRIDNAE